MSLFLKTQMAEKPSCFVIDSDEESDSEGTLSVVDNAANYKFDGLCEDFLDANDPLSVNEGPTTETVTNFQTLNGHADGNGLSLAANGAVCTQGDEETGLDDFEFDFQSIDEAEKTEHILKVRVHANFCMRCGAGFVQQKKLNVHLGKNECSANTFSSETPLTCSICGRGFVRRNCLRHHFMLHAQTKPFKCKKCSRSFMTQKDLYSHYKTHDDYSPFICNLCPKTYISSKHLAAHRGRDHAGKRPYCCRLCPKRFNCSENLLIHKRKHASKKPFKCKFCKKSYAQNSVRNLHMRTHTKNNSSKFSFLCEICGMTHVSFRWSWFNPFPDFKRRESDDSIICVGEYKSKKSKPEKRQPQPNTIIRRRISSASSTSIEIVEDPLQFTIDLVDD